MPAPPAPAIEKMLKAPWRIEMLGGLQARQGDLVVTRFRSHRTAALLAFLACHPDRVHAREELVELLWPEGEPEAGRASLRTALSSLRRQLEPPGRAAPGSVFVADRTHVRLHPGAVVTDRAEFEAALRSAGHALDDGERGRALLRAAELYRGPLLPGFYEPWAVAERERLEDAAASALRRLIALLESQKDYDRAIDYAHRALRADPLREEPYRALMRLYVAAGRPADALRSYRELERVFSEELDEAPSAATRALAAQLAAAARLHDNPPPAAQPRRAAAPPPAPELSTVARLPLAPTRFFGRDGEMSQLWQMIGSTDVRLLTLTGPGGSGKTRLAVEAARALAADGSGGAAVWFVRLADVTDPFRIPGAIADALGLARSDTAEPLERVVDALHRATRDQPGLLVLDNFEQLAEGGVLTVLSLLRRVPALTCLVTSRRPLALEHEHEIPVAPLPVPAASDDDAPWTAVRLAANASVRLFTDRAQRASPDFQVTAGNADAVAGLCRLLEGIPLAIELAGARARVLTPGQMLETLSTDRFPLLTRRGSAAPDGDARHRSLWATLDWSFRLLPPELRRFFARLSVFRGGWSQAAAETVCEEPRALEYLTQLRVHSLVQTEDAGDEMRFRMLETLREFAGEQLTPDERGFLARRHLHFFRDLAEQTEPKIHGPEQSVLLDRLEREHDNVRAALTWSQNDPAEGESGLRLAGALSWFWHLRSHFVEGRSWLERVLESRPVATDARATALQGAGQLTYYLGDHAGAQVLLEESARLWRDLGNRRGTAYALVYLGAAAFEQGDHGTARAVLAESVALARATEDRWVLAMALWMSGEHARFQGDDNAACPLLEESAALFRRVGDRWGLIGPLLYLGKIAQKRRDYPAARRTFQECVTTARAVGDPFRLAATLVALGQFMVLDGDCRGAAAPCQESLTLLRDTGGTWGIAFALETLAQLVVVRAADSPADHRAAVRLLGAAESLRESIRFPPSPDEKVAFDALLAAARATLRDEAFAAAWAEGRSMTQDQAMVCALEIVDPHTT